MRHRLRFRLTLLLCLVSVTSGAVLVLLMVALARTLGDVDANYVRDGPGGVPAPIPRPEGFDAETMAVPVVALAIIAVLSVLLGWVIAGRMLTPVLTMTERLHSISERNVHERLSLPGPRNELTDLGDTVDELLGRLETALDSHKRFVANAAHELRTPLTVERALLEEPLIDSAASLESFRANFERLLVINDQQGRLLESLLTLTGVEHGSGRAEPVELATLIEKTVKERMPEAARRGLRVETSLRPLTVHGDQVLVTRLLANLCDNAIHYNVAGGGVEVAVRRKVGRVVLSVSNDGQVVPPDQVDRLFEPFHRLHRTAADGHHGLGLSIVRAIAQAHGATVTAKARPGGGLAIDVAFPAIAV